MKQRLSVTTVTLIIVLTLVSVMLELVVSRPTPVLAQSGCSPVANTPRFTIVYGTVEQNGQPASIGSVVVARDPRGDTVGCFVVSSPGNYGAMYVYGEDNSISPPIPGMRSGEIVTFFVNGVSATAAPLLSWTNDKDLHQINLSVTTPPISPVLSIASQGLNIVLTWTDHPFNVSYEIHRSLTPFFTPTSGTLLTSLPTGSTSYTDVGAAGQVSVNHFYIVRALGSGTVQSANSNEVGEIDYPLNNSGGRYSLMALPFPTSTITNAVSLATKIGRVGALLKWNPATQTFRFFVPPATGDNFLLVPGETVFVVVNSGGPNVVTMVGGVTAIQHNLRLGGYNFISLPLQRSDLSNAAAVAGSITRVNAMFRWNEATQAFRFFVPPATGDNFPLGIGTPFVIDLASNGPTRWP